MGVQWCLCTFIKSNDFFNMWEIKMCVCIYTHTHACTDKMERRLNSQKGHDAPETHKKIKLTFNFPTLHRFLLLSPEPSPTFSAWTINSPSMCSKRMAKEAPWERDRERDRMCRAHNWGGADSYGLRLVWRRCVKLGLQKRGGTLSTLNHPK